MGSRKLSLCLSISVSHPLQSLALSLSPPSLLGLRHRSCAMNQRWPRQMPSHTAHACDDAHTYACTHACTDAFTYAFTHARTDARTDAFTDACADAFTECPHRCLHRGLHRCLHICLHRCPHMPAHMPSHIRMPHMPAQMCSQTYTIIMLNFPRRSTALQGAA